MGFHIPDSPPRRSVSSTSSQTATATTSTSTSTTSSSANTTSFRERFSMRRRNAITPDLFIDVAGSPRSPYVCLSRDNRVALSQQSHDFAQQTSSEQQQLQQEDVMSAAAGVDAASSDTQMASNEQIEPPKRVPGVRRRVEQRSVGTDTLLESRASLNVRDMP